jgi:hypothetical protein
MTHRMSTRSFLRRFHAFPSVSVGFLVVTTVLLPAAAEPGITGKSNVKSERFDADPKWESFNNRMTPEAQDVHAVIQDFGFSETHFAGSAKGELGGKVQRSTQPAFYAEKIREKTLNDKLTASGKFVFTEAESSAGIWFGWFSSKQEAGAARPKGGLGLNMDFEKDGGRLAVRLSNSANNFCGTFITPYIPGKFRPAPLLANTRYAWTLSYDPMGNHGDGQFQFRLSSDRINEDVKAKAKELPAELQASLALRSDGQSKHGSPDFDRGITFIVNLPPGFKDAGATFDHFGLLSSMKEGNQVHIYFDDLQYDEKTQDFAADPQWEGSGNRARFREGMPTGYHDFGFSAKTGHAGGTPGEMGGTFWRLTKAFGYYADSVGPLSLEEPLEASGKLVLHLGTPDSEMAFGWFNSSQKSIPVHLKNGRQQEGHLDKTDHFVGVYLAGPSRLGRCLLPAVITGKGTRAIFNTVDRAPRPVPKQVYDWTMKYDPRAAGGQGSLMVTLGGTTATLTLDPGLKAEGAVLDRFGFFPCGGGGMVQIYFDDLRYTSTRSGR